MLKKVVFGFSLTVFLFFFIYDPPLRFLNFNFTTLFGAISLLCLLIRILIRRTFSDRILRYLAPFVLVTILAIYSLLLPVIKNTGDYQIARLLSIFILIYLPTSFLIVLVLKRFRYFFTLRNLFQFIVMVCFIQAVIILTMFLNHEFKAWIYALLRDDRTEFNLLSGGIRMLGFAYSTVWDLSFLQSIGLLLIVFLIQDRSSLKIFVYTVIYLFIVISIIFSGRTGFIGVVFSFALLVLVPINNHRAFSKASLLLPTYMIGIVVCILGFLRAFLPSDVKDVVSDKVVPWAFEIFINNSESGKLQTVSSDDLKTMYFPVSGETFFAGDGLYRDSIDPEFYYKDTDAGYMRHVLFYGVIGSVVLYFFYLSIFFVLIFTTYKNGMSSLSVLYFTMLIYYFIGHIKGDLFVGAAMPIRVLFLIYVFHSCIKTKGEYGFNLSI